jgi:hypothetical protein
MLEITKKFRFVRETSGALRYHEELGGGLLAEYPNTLGAAIGVLYIRKSAIKGKTPDQLTVTIAYTEKE